MKKMLISLSALSFFISLSAQSTITLENLRNDKEKLNSMTEVLCNKIDKEVMINSDKMMCLNIINEGFKVNNFYSYYVFYNFLESKVNTNREINKNEMKSLYNKMKKIAKNEEEELLFKNIK